MTQKLIAIQSIHCNMTTIFCVKCPMCGKFTPINIATFKSGNPPDLADIQVRECKGKKGFPVISKSTLRKELDEHLKLADELVDMAGGILWLCWEEGLYNKIHPPLLINKYSSLLEQLKENKKLENNLRLQVDDLSHDNSKLIKVLKNEKENREQLSIDYDDAQDQITQLQIVIKQYEEASIK